MMMVMMHEVVHRQSQPRCYTENNEHFGHVEVSHMYSF